MTSIKATELWLIRLAGACALLLTFGTSAKDCYPDSFGAVHCSDGVTYHRQYGGYKGSDGSEIRKGLPGELVDDNGTSWSRDQFDHLQGSNGQACYSDSFGNMQCNN